VTPFTDFDEAARAALKFLHKRLGFDLWMVTRTQGDDWIVLQTEDQSYGIQDGTVFQWADTFCARMVEGQGPRVAPRSREVPAYANAPIGRQLDIQAYIGVPLTGAGGALFGTLCAIDSRPQPETLVEEQALVELVGALLSSLLRTEMQLMDEVRRSERAQAEALTDALTGLYNRRGWARLLEAEENRCRRYGHSACVVAVDLDNLKRVNDSHGHFAGDELIARAAGVLASVARAQDIAARVGGDEFLLLAVECDRSGAATLADRLRADFAFAGVNASIGYALRDPARGLTAAWDEADKAMYLEKSRA
jgi:diguanylate cyclase (GGDEF)-like protein